MNDYRWKKIQVGDIVKFKTSNKIKSRYRGYVAKVLSVESGVLYVSCRGLCTHCHESEVSKQEKAYENMGSRVEIVSDCKSKGRTGIVVETRFPGYNTRITVQLDATSNLPSRKMTFECYSVRGV